MVPKIMDKCMLKVTSKLKASELHVRSVHRIYTLIIMCA